LNLSTSTSEGIGLVEGLESGAFFFGTSCDGAAV